MEVALRPVPSIDHLPLGRLAPYTLDNWRVPAAFIFGYVVIVKSINRAYSRSATKPTGLAITRTPLFKVFVFLHNLFLAVYSGVTFYYALTWQIRNFRTHSTRDAFCDASNELTMGGHWYLGYLFYLSKYYEVIDTAIILAKGKKSSLLQTFHHAGAILIMYTGVSLHSIAMWLFVFPNSFIHTLMYTRYSLGVLGINPPGKKYLTMAQIAQFVIGGSVAAMYFFMDNCMYSPKELIPVALCLVYLVLLIKLFVDFFISSYSAKPAVTAEKKQTKTE